MIKNSVAGAMASSWLGAPASLVVSVVSPVSLVALVVLVVLVVGISGGVVWY